MTNQSEDDLLPWPCSGLREDVLLKVIYELRTWTKSYSNISPFAGSRAKCFYWSELFIGSWGMLWVIAMAFVCQPTVRLAADWIQITRRGPINNFRLLMNWSGKREMDLGPHVVRSPKKPSSSWLMGRLRLTSWWNRLRGNHPIWGRFSRNLNLSLSRAYFFWHVQRPSLIICCCAASRALESTATP